MPAKAKSEASVSTVNGKVLSIGCRAADADVVYFKTSNENRASLDNGKVDLICGRNKTESIWSNTQTVQSDVVVLFLLLEHVFSAVTALFWDPVLLIDVPPCIPKSKFLSEKTEFSFH